MFSETTQKCDSGCPKIAELAVNSKIEDRWNNFSPAGV